ncbi:hypothetical protein [Streptomyces sp. XY332]|uniref:hypothetical protein n=1 Tax=Streptomyces sp. XY332 TaxID=1415561 RepID=UPI0006B1C036|nr:hypothetical protein [Streptomyces sp. XY332]KOY59843.1 hypothetical protein ADK59_00950 [Streptomyces sp. XY332]
MPSHITSFRFSRTVVVALAAGLLLYGCSFEDTGQKTATADATVAEPVTSVDGKDARRGSIEVTPGTGARGSPSTDARLAFAKPPTSVTAKTPAGRATLRALRVQPPSESVFAGGERGLGNIGGRTCIESA